MSHLTHLLRHATFGDLALRLYPEVHEPGLDTEMLVAHIPADVVGEALVLGCGMGLETLVLLRKKWKVLAVDINPLAADATWRNAVANQLENGLQARVDDQIHALDEDKTWDLIMVNPPQLPTPLESRRLDWIGLANNGGATGTEVLDTLCACVPKRLAPGGVFMLVQLDFNPIDRTAELLKGAGLVVTVSEREMKRMGALSFERRPSLRLRRNDDEYGIVIITATRPVSDLR